MQTRRLGRAGTQVSELCLGTMTFGQETDEPAAHGILDRFADAGGTFIDTADVYAAGVSEEIIGRWLKRRGRHDDLVIATKARFPVGDGAPSGLSRRYLRRAVEANLRRLGVERIDLHQAHCWDPNTPIEETLDTYEDLVREGKIDYVGVSNFAGWHLQRTMLLGRERPRALPVTVQPQYSLLQRGLEWEVGPVCAQEDVGILPWSPLGGGWLAGKYRRGERPTGATRLGEDPSRGQEAWDRRGTEQTWAVLDVVREIAEARGKSMSQVAINWVNHRPNVVAAILGVRTAEQLEDNLGAAGWELEPEERARLDEVSAPPLPEYPYGFIEEEGSR
jgi:aryl-alcohol dehydrogenase-like predicted oxidoreductase